MIEAETCCHLITLNKIDIYNTNYVLACESLLLTCIGFFVMWPFYGWERKSASSSSRPKDLMAYWPCRWLHCDPPKSHKTLSKRQSLTLQKQLYFHRQFSTVPTISIYVKHVGCNLLMWLCVGRPQYEINYTSRGVLNNATHDDLHMTRSLWLLRDVPSGNYHSLLCCNDDI